jgi:general secretion pathway protein I
MGSDRGFTLLEVMVALVIIATSFVVLLHSRNQSVLMADDARHITEATLLAAQKMTEIELGGFPDVGEDEGEFGDEFPGYRWKGQVSEVPTYDFIREVRLSVLWGELGKERSVDLVSYVREEK